MLCIEVTPVQADVTVFSCRLFADDDRRKSNIPKKYARIYFCITFHWFLLLKTMNFLRTFSKRRKIVLRSGSSGSIRSRRIDINSQKNREIHHKRTTKFFLSDRRNSESQNKNENVLLRFWYFEFHLIDLWFLHMLKVLTNS